MATETHTHCDRCGDRFKGFSLGGFSGDFCSDECLRGWPKRRPATTPDEEMGLPPNTLRLLGLLRIPQVWLPLDEVARRASLTEKTTKDALDALVKAGMVDHWHTVEAEGFVTLYRLKEDV